ncbi:MAG: translation initiation factor IF-3 [Planctomycetes bacterium]|nr:translation initiation factor IF-3 [Planctomycetota bacterium]
MSQEIKHRINHQIRVPDVMLIDDQGEQLGTMPTTEARRMAEEAGMDLVEVAPMARPPVCKIMDYGKFKYQLKKKKKHTHQATTKEVRVRPKIDPHDLEIKVARARKFLDEGDKVQFTCLFRGREMAHKELGMEVLNRAMQELQDVVKVERPARLEGRRITMLVTRKAKK